MKRRLVLFLLLSAEASSETLPPPSIADAESGAVVAKDGDDRVRWRAEWTMKRVTENGEPRVELTETGQGIYTPFASEVRWELRTVWSAEQDYRPLSAERTFYGPEGEKLLVERKRLDFARGVARFERLVFAEAPVSPVDRELDLPPDTLIVEGIAAALRSLPFDPPRAHSAHLLTNEPKIYQVRFAPRGEETLTLPGGELACYRVELVPELGILDLFRAFLPDIHFWLTRDPPHYWARYQGPESGPGSPQIVIEIRGQIFH